MLSVICFRSECQVRAACLRSQASICTCSLTTCLRFTEIISLLPSSVKILNDVSQYHKLASASFDECRSLQCRADFMLKGELTCFVCHFSWTWSKETPWAAAEWICWSWKQPGHEMIGWATWDWPGEWMWLRFFLRLNFTVGIVLKTWRD